MEEKLSKEPDFIDTSFAGMLMAGYAIERPYSNTAKEIKKLANSLKTKTNLSVHACYWLSKVMAS